MMNRTLSASAFVLAASLLAATPAGVNAQGKPQSGTAAFALVEVEPGLLGFASGTDQGVPGRFVTLQGDIDGLNFEPGFCHPGIDMTLGFPTSCVVFGEGPGQFTRLRTGGTAFTTCYCTVAGVGEAGDSFLLKISYPPATPPQYPFGFTKFTFQDGTGALAALRGQGTLDFGAFPQISFSYHFAGR